MKLYLMRHGHSPSVTEAGVMSDAERPLSPQGREAVAAMSRRLKASGAKISLIVHSPYKRAEQTASEAAAVLKPSQPPKIFQPLENLVGAEDLARELSAPLAKAGEILAVGHQPQLGEFAAWLAGRLFDLRPGGLIALELDALAARKAVVLLSRNPGDPE